MTTPPVPTNKETDMSDRLTPGQLRDLADLWEKSVWSTCGVNEILRRIAAKREAELDPRPTPADTLAPHEVRLPSGAVMEVLGREGERGMWFAFPGKEPCVSQRFLLSPGPPYERFCRAELKLIPRPVHLTDEILSDVQAWLDARGIEPKAPTEGGAK
jgi:hypothetical protein